MVQKFPIDSAWFFARLREKGYSLRRFAGEMAMDPSAVSRMLNGQRNMTADEQDRVAVLLHLPLQEVAAHRKPVPEGLSERTQAGYEALDAGESPAERPVRKNDDPYRHPIFGCMKGTMIIPDDLDLTAPADPDWFKVYDDE